VVLGSPHGRIGTEMGGHHQKKIRHPGIIGKPCFQCQSLISQAYLRQDNRMGLERISL
jgi:hypothetical protein